MNGRTRVVMAFRIACTALVTLGLDQSAAQAQESNRRPDSVTASHRTIALPALGSAPETGLQFGATLLLVREPPPVRHARPTSIKSYALLTAERQQRLGVETEWWASENRWQLTGTLLWQRFPLPYYGIGDRAPEAAKEIFTPQGPEATIATARRIAPSTYLIAGARWSHQTIALGDSSVALRQGAVVGNRGGQTTQLTFGLQNDTRDNLFATSSGHWLQGSWSWADPVIGSDFSFSRLRLDARQYVAVRQRHVLAMQAQLLGTTGAPSFDQLALVGASDITRGLACGRYRDRWMFATQLEYRAPIVGRLGAVVFGGTGVVAARASQLRDGRLLTSAGGGIRWQLDQRQRTAIRVDYAVGIEHASGLYIGFNQAF